MKTIALLFLLVVLCNCVRSSNVEKGFCDFQIVPDVLNCPPKRFLNVSYPSGVSANLGNELTPTQMKDEPTLSWAAEKGAYYALLLVDPDVPSRADPAQRELRHWCVVNIPETSVDEGDVIFEFLGAAPPKGAGLHRYVFMVFKQPDGIIDFDEQYVSNTDQSNRTMTSTRYFANKYNLGTPLFGNFVQAKYDKYVDKLSAQLS